MPADPADHNRAPAPPQPRREWRAALLLALLCFLVYNANLRLVTAGDTYPARYIPLNLLHKHTLYLDPVIDLTSQGQVHPYWIVPGRHGHSISLYPVVTPVLIAPLYLPAAAWLDARGWKELDVDFAGRIMEKIAASLIAGLSVALVYLLLRRRADVRTAVLLTLAYGLGTETWMIGSQALWQHGMGELLIVIGLLLVTGRCTAWRAVMAGVVCALIACNRPPDAVLAAAIGMAALLWAGRKAPLVFAGVAAGAAPFLAYNLTAAGTIFGGYTVLPNHHFFRESLLAGFASILFSPVCGLLPFTPFLLFLPAAAWRAMRGNPGAPTGDRPLAFFICIAVVIQFLAYAKAQWLLSCSWGPRWFTEMMPLFAWLLAPHAAAMRRPARAAFATLAAVSILIQAVGAFWYTGESYLRIAQSVGSDGHGAAAWDASDNEIAVELLHPPAPRDLLLRTRGSIDTIVSAGKPISSAPAGTVIDVAGWSRVGGRTPALVRLSLMRPYHDKPLYDAIPIALTNDFQRRPDVNLALGTSVPCAWKAALQTAGLVPGDYIIEATAQSAPGGEFRRVAYTGFKVLPPESPEVALGALAREAAARIREHQAPAGYWITCYTASTRFENPVREMNTYLTSMLADLLGPVAADCGLGENLARARSHLAAQIEDSGLVRYHGRPDSPTIPSLGAVITPDADDTALVWRVTGGAGRESLLPRTLETLESYRAPDGLYRTWLAPREEYVNVDLGRIDIGVQMHLLLFFAKTNPAAARALHAALEGVTGDKRLWVYYEKTPLVPLLREADLRNAGYPLTLPQERTQTQVPGQQDWVEACRLLARYETGPKPSPQETLPLLQKLAGRRFSPIHNNPPLFYDNDLIAGGHRFYWSEDFGYALWLRLYMENMHRDNPAPAR